MIVQVGYPTLSITANHIKGLLQTTFNPAVYSVLQKIHNILDNKVMNLRDYPLAILYMRSSNISGSSWNSFILTVSERIMWRLKTRSLTYAERKGLKRTQNTTGNDCKIQKQNHCHSYRAKPYVKGRIWYPLYGSMQESID